MLKFLTPLSLACFSQLAAGEWPDFSDHQQFQKELDGKYFEINEGFEKLRHVLLHLVKTTGKIAAYCECKEHGKEGDVDPITDEALPDLVMHALQIANLFEVDLGEKYADRVNFIVRRAEQGGFSR